MAKKLFSCNWQARYSTSTSTVGLAKRTSVFPFNRVKNASFPFLVPRSIYLLPSFVHVYIRTFRRLIFI